MTSDLTWIEQAARFAEVRGLRYRVGQRSRSLRTQANRYGLPADLVPVVLANSVAGDLYETFYARGGAEPTGPFAEVANSDMEGILRAANRGAGGWEPGWDLVRQEPHRWIVAKHGTTFAVPVARVRPSAAGVEVLHAPDLPRLSPGFYMFLSEAWLDPGAPQLVRTYWHLTPVGGSHFVEAVSSALNAAGEPFRAKVVSSRAAFDRRDAGVVYVPLARWPEVAPLLKDVADRLNPVLREGSPAMTKILQKGIGLAEDPRGGQSFGMSRCLLVASAIVRSDGAGSDRVAARVQSIREAFEANELDPARPYLNPGSEDRYTWPAS